MVVDDEKRLVSLVQSYLTQEGYRVVTAYNGKEALTVARREKPDLIVITGDYVNLSYNRDEAAYYQIEQFLALLRFENRKKLEELPGFEK